MFGLGPLELILIVVVIALLFGARKLPELGKGMGQGIREFKKEVKDGEAARSGSSQATDVPSRDLGPVPEAGRVQVVHTPAVENPNERR